MSKLQGPQTVIFPPKLEPNVPPHHGRTYNISCQRIAHPNPYDEHSRHWLLRLTDLLPQFVECVSTDRFLTDTTEALARIGHRPPEPAWRPMFDRSSETARSVRDMWEQRLIDCPPRIPGQ